MSSTPAKPVPELISDEKLQKLTVGERKPHNATSMQGIERTVSLCDALLYHGYLDCVDDVERAQWVTLLADWRAGTRSPTTTPARPGRL
jgi:hypothetical protein